MIDELKQTLQTRFQLSDFRLGQAEIIQSIMERKDILAVLPTGGGKSLCYQLPAVLHQKLVVVISPLIALMKDQVAGLKRINIAAGCLHSGQTEEEKREVFRQIYQSSEFLLYISPERAQKEGFQIWIQTQNIALFAIDEAHCISQWGHDFRSEYSQLKILKKLRPDVPVLALTASATPVVLSDISRNLGLHQPERHIHGFYRPNLYYQVQYCGDEEAKLIYLLQSLRQNPQGRVIVYCGTRKTTEATSEFLEKYFVGVGYYHAGRTTQQRNEVQQDYETGKIRILVATNAFGMGIDHPDVRLVVHYQMPGNIDALYQEMGRAGRDGFDSTCMMLYSKKDKGLQSFFIQQSDAPQDIKNARYRNLDALISYSEVGECRHAGILTYYRDAQRIESCGHCDTCDPQSTRKIVKPDVNALIESLENQKAESTQMFPKPKTKKRRNAAPNKNEISLDQGDEKYFQILREWRRLKSKELDCAAFVILSDKTLKELALVKPTNLNELEKIYGFGETKLEKFGKDVLQCLQQEI